MVYSLFRFLCPAAFLVFLTGCAVPSPPQSELLYVKAGGFGLFVRDGGFTLGILKDERLYLPDGSDCRLILINNNPDELKQLISMLKEAGTPPSQICAAQPQGKK